MFDELFLNFALFIKFEYSLWSRMHLLLKILVYKKLRTITLRMSATGLYRVSFAVSKMVEARYFLLKGALKQRHVRHQEPEEYGLISKSRAHFPSAYDVYSGHLRK